MAKRVVILGGGFGGVYTDVRLVRLRSLRDDVQVTLVSRETYFGFQPMLPEVISGAIGILDPATPIRGLAPGTTLYICESQEVNLETRTVTLVPDFTRRATVPGYDQLVIALGNVTDFRQMPGMIDHPPRNMGFSLHAS